MEKQPGTYIHESQQPRQVSKEDHILAFSGNSVYLETLRREELTQIYRPWRQSVSTWLIFLAL